MRPIRRLYGLARRTTVSFRPASVSAEAERGPGVWPVPRHCGPLLGLLRHRIRDRGSQRTRRRHGRRAQYHRPGRWLHNVWSSLDNAMARAGHAHSRGAYAVGNVDDPPERTGAKATPIPEEDMVFKDEPVPLSRRGRRLYRSQFSTDESTSTSFDTSIGTSAGVTAAGIQVGMGAGTGGAGPPTVAGQRSLFSGQCPLCRTTRAPPRTVQPLRLPLRPCGLCHWYTSTWVTRRTADDLRG